MIFNIFLFVLFGSVSANYEDHTSGHQAPAAIRYRSVFARADLDGDGLVQPSEVGARNKQ